MFPNVAFLGLVGALALAIAPVYPFSGWRGLAKNIVVSIAVAYLFVGIGVLLGLIFHYVIFGEPVFID